MKTCLIMAMILLLFAGASFTVFAGEKKKAPPPPQTHCPISGHPVDGQFYADVEGFRVLAAGPNEAEEIRRNPEKAFSALAKKRQAAVPVVWVCPNMRQQVSQAYPFVQQAGKRIYYCCAPCQPVIRKDFKKAANILRQLAGQ